jgi:hypothetical protein
MFYNPEIDELNLADIDSDIKRKYFEELDSKPFISKDDFKAYVQTVLNQPHYLDVFQAFGKWQYDLRSESISLPILKKKVFDWNNQQVNVSVSLLSVPELRNRFACLDFQVKVGKETSQFQIKFNYHETKTQTYSAFGLNKFEKVTRFLYTSCDITKLNSTLTSDLLDVIFQKALLK